MIWYEITIHTTEEAIEMVSNFLHDLGSAGVSIEESGTLNKQRDTSLGQWYEGPLNDIPEGQAVIKGYYSHVSEQQIEQWIHQLTQSIEQLREYDIDPGKFTITYKVVDEADWANEWKRYYKPVKISDTLVIKPTWEPYEAADKEIVIEMDPGMAFGTGTHETTSLCLRLMEQVIQPGDQVIDIGTGSGILAVAAARLGAKHVLAIDLDPVAVESAQINAELNGLTDRITVRLGDLLEQQDGGELPQAQLIIANILAEIIMSFVSDVYDALAPGGIYIASGIIRDKEAAVETALKAAGFRIDRKEYENDWVAIVSSKS